MTSIPSNIQNLIDEHFSPLICPPNGTPSPTQAPGGICGIFFDGTPYYYPAGFIDGSGAAPTSDTIFGLGSVTKVLTTSIVGQQSHSTLTGSVKDYLPNGYQLTTNEQPVTFAQLASFTGGVNPSQPSQGNNCTQQEFECFINALAPSALPAADQYSDASIGFLAQIVMSMAGYSSFTASTTEQWFNDNLLTALSMNSTGTSAPSTSENGSAAYTYENGAYQTVNYEGWVPWGAAGRAYSTCADMMNFVQANAGVSTINNNTVPQDILTGMQVAQSNWAPPEGDGYWRQGFAWKLIKDETSGTVYCGKAGGVTGVSSFVTVCAEPQLGVVFLTNMQGVKTEAPAQALTAGLLAL